MKKLLFLLLLIPLMSFGQTSHEYYEMGYEKYTFKSGEYNGIGKWYMGREIAYVMGFEGIGWLERSQREKEENVSNLVQNMGINPNDTIA